MLIVVNQHNSQCLNQDKEKPVLEKKHIRKFRVKFASDNGKSVQEQKNSCVSKLQELINVIDGEEELQDGETTEKKNILQNVTPLKDIVKKLLEKSKEEPNHLPEWDGVNYLLKEDVLLERTIRLCLLDPSFPELVRCVEEKLSKALC